MDEILQVIDQVKVELADAELNHQHTIDIAEKQKEQIVKLKKLVVRMSKEIAVISAERDAAVADLNEDHKCHICAHADCQWDDYPCSSCVHSGPVDNFYSHFEWRGVCPENTEED